MILRPQDAAALIKETASAATVLVGGQAVAFWAAHFRAQPRLPALTRDIDYFGTAAQAKKASARLTFRHKLKIATLDDATPNAAVLAIYLEGYEHPILIDYLQQIIGLESREINKSAVLIEYEGQQIKVLHPLLLLRAKVSNLYQLEVKRTPEGIEQARLSIEIAAAFVCSLIDVAAPQRELLKSIESIARFAATDAARYVKQNYNLDCFGAIPQRALSEGVLPVAFHEKRWPQLKSAASSKRGRE